jgi:positive regulator of sigma E activity
MSSSQVEHQGVVLSVSENIVKVQIFSESACASCHLKSACTTSDRKEKIIDVCAPGGNYCPGQKVCLSIGQHLGFLALTLAYLVPFALVVSSLFIFSVFFTELAAGIMSVLLLVPYYAVIYLLKDYFVKTFHYSLKHLQA